jgi:hypothetical protein
MILMRDCLPIGPDPLTIGPPSRCEYSYAYHQQEDAMAETTKPLEPKEVIVTVPKGEAHNVKVVEEETQRNAEITVKVSRKRKAATVPLLGLMVK